MTGPISSRPPQSPSSCAGTRPPTDRGSQPPPAPRCHCLFTTARSAQAQWSRRRPRDSLTHPPIYRGTSWAATESGPHRGGGGQAQKSAHPWSISPDDRPETGTPSVSSKALRRSAPTEHACSEVNHHKETLTAAGCSGTRAPHERDPGPWRSGLPSTAASSFAIEGIPRRPTPLEQGARPDWRSRPPPIPRLHDQQNRQNRQGLTRGR